ncbi:MAG: pyruvate, phosphate dikinase, partial [Deltaproteobacteria bacterium]|nr:pyruvate, phosphate dikinase [Deltaproteobacteria bacterium]
MPQSKALEVNLETSRVEVCLDPKYEVLQKITANYYGLLQGLLAFLEEVCHPYKNYRFIVSEARKLALNNFHLFRGHPEGPEGAKLLIDIFLEAVAASQEEVRADAVDNLLVYLQEIINESDSDLGRFLDILDYGFMGLKNLDEESFTLVTRSFYQVKRLAQDMDRAAPPKADFKVLNALLARCLKQTYDYWLSESDPQAWFETQTGQAVKSKRLTKLFGAISHQRLKENQQKLAAIRPAQSDHSRQVLTRLAGLPSYKEIVAHYEQLPQELAAAGERTGTGYQWKLIFLFHIMNISGLASIHERTLREVNRSLTWLIGHEEVDLTQSLIAGTFRILAHSAHKYPQTALNCILNMGQAVYRTDESDLVEFFLASVIELGFQTPDLKGVGDNWEVLVNAAHLQNVRTWLQLIELNPRWSKKLLSSLIIHLALSGAFIKDTDLLPRDITQLLNSDIKPVYNLVKQLCRLFPA